MRLLMTKIKITAEECKQTMIERVIYEIKGAFDGDDDEIQKHILEIICRLRILNCPDGQSCQDCILHDGKSFNKFLEEYPEEWE